MDLMKWINSSAGSRGKYDYYLSLGYSDKAAQVLSVFTYGEEKTAFLVEQFGSERVIENLYSWLQDRKEDSPEEAIFAYYAKKHSRPKYEEREKRSSFAGLFRSRAKTSPAPGASILGAALNAPSFLNRSEAPKKAAPPLPRPSANISAGQGLSRTMESLGACPEELLCCAAPSLDASFMEALSTDAYESIEEKSAKNVFTAPTSTFRMSTSSASMGIILNQIREGRRVSMDQVRIEEVLNYFDYDVEIPTDAKFKISTELLEKQGNKKLLFIGAQAANETKEHQNIILLLDTSGSMHSNNEVTQEAIGTIFSKLNAGDRVSLVTYSTVDHTVLEGYEIKSEQDKEELMGILLGIEIDGCTHGSAGIETAYRIGEKYYQPEQNNQVILITDGDLNFGITNKQGLQKLIEEKKKSCLFLSVIGTGLFNYKDDKLEVLTKHGNGTYCVVNSLEDVDESVNRHYIALTNIVAKDVKAQVEFNPRFVKAYRLLGYENRQLNHEDFQDDTVISEPYGSGGHGIALYELEMNDGREAKAASDLKYQTPVLTESDELGTVSIRYKEPLGEESVLIEEVVYNTNHSTQNAELAYFLYCLSEKLRGSDKLDEYDEQFLNEMITSGKYQDFSGPNKEKLEMLVKAFRQNNRRNESRKNLDIPPWLQ